MSFCPGKRPIWKKNNSNKINKTTSAERLIARMNSPATTRVLDKATESKRKIQIKREHEIYN